MSVRFILERTYHNMDVASISAEDHEALPFPVTRRATQKANRHPPSPIRTGIRRPPNSFSPHSRNAPAVSQ